MLTNISKPMIAIFFSIIAISYIIFNVCCSVIPAASVEEVFMRLPNKLNYSIYQKGRELKQEIITVGDEKYDQLKMWLLAHTEGWKKDYVSHAPKELFWYYKTNINVQNNIVVINYGNQNQISMSRKFGEDPYIQQIWHEP